MATADVPGQGQAKLAMAAGFPFGVGGDCRRLFAILFGIVCTHRPALRLAATLSFRGLEASFFQQKRGDP
jgi:hypothetical protein